MEKRKWKKSVLRGDRFRVQLTKPKIQCFAPENNTPHGRETITVTELQYRKRKQAWVEVEVTSTIPCQCKACKRHLELLQVNLAPIITASGFIPASEPNIARYQALTENDGKPQEYKRPKPLPEHVHKRRLLAYSLRKW